MIARLRGKGLREIGTRGGQLASVLLERAGLSAEGRPVDGAQFARWVDSRSPAVALEIFRHRAAAAFPSFEDPAGAGAAMQRLWPAETAALLDRAGRAIEGRFDLLGYRDLSFGPPLDWQLDPISGRRSPLVHWSRLPYLDHAAVGDHKVVWELNRHAHFGTLAHA